ncbi:hypothetical protein Fmac_031142 [Flemingia macrophylla]|uniref:Uncharacterized protein n=1 Tax=Flemingia macrophylla TaxID=520843 RepID=A0ABD1L189_9FABA
MVQSLNTLVIHPRHSGSDNESMKITVAGSSVGGVSETRTIATDSGAGDIQMVKAGNMEGCYRKYEIAILTKVRYRHLVALLGYCLDGNEKLLVAELAGHCCANLPQFCFSAPIFLFSLHFLSPAASSVFLSAAASIPSSIISSLKSIQRHHLPLSFLVTLPPNKSHRQTGGYECGYYVMHTMRVIVNVDITNVWIQCFSVRWKACSKFWNSLAVFGGLGG